MELHVEMAQLSARGKLVVLPDSGHMIPYEAPEAVVEAVRSVIDEIQTPVFRVKTVAAEHP